MFRYGAGRKRSPSGSKSETVQKRCETSGSVLQCICVQGHWLCPGCQVTCFFSALNCRKLMQHLKISKYSNLDTCKLNARLHTGIAAWTCRRRPQRSFRQRRRVSHLLFLLWMGRDTKLSENFWNSKLSKLSKKRSSAWSKGRKVWRGGQGSQALIFVVKILKQVAATVAAEANQERLLEDRKSGLRKLAVVISGQEWPVITFVTRRKSSEIEVEALVLHAFRRKLPNTLVPATWYRIWHRALPSNHSRVCSAEMAVVEATRDNLIFRSFRVWLSIAFCV